MSEIFQCLYCDATLVGDEAWLEHLKTLKHGAVKRYIDSERAGELYTDADE